MSTGFVIYFLYEYFLRRLVFLSFDENWYYIIVRVVVLVVEEEVVLS